MRICEAFRPVLTKFNKQKKEIIAEIDSIQDHVIRLVQQTGTQRNKRGAPLEFVSSAAKGLFGFAKHVDVIEMGKICLICNGVWITALVA